MPGLALQITDARSADVSEQWFQHNGGISEFCEFLAADEAITDVIRLRGQDRFTETVPMLDAEGHMEPWDVERDLDMDIAVRWGTGYESTIRSYVNIIATPKGGTHVAGFERTDADIHRRAATDSVAEGGGGDRQGRRPRGDDSGHYRTAGRAAVRGPDQGGTRYAGRRRAGHQGRTPGADELDLDEGHDPRPGPAGAGESRRSLSARAARQHRDAQRRKSALESSRCRPSSWTAAAPTSTVRAVHR